MTEHTPDRPTWDCRVCGAAWPCAPGKVQMVEEFEGSRLSLVMYLWAQMTDAVDDYMATGADVPKDLFERIVHWERTQDTASASRRTAAEG